MFEKRKTEEEKFQMNLMNCKNEKERDTFRASETSFDAHKLYSTCLNDKACAIIFLNYVHTYPSKHSICREILLKNEAC